MRKLIAILLTIAAVAGLCGCGTYVEPGKPGTPSGSDSENQNPTGGEELTFTVKLTLGGEEYIPQSEISAIWNDGIAEYTARFDSKGVAQFAGLDGEYFVTLSDLSGERKTLTYDPNSYVATNENKDIQIELLEITRLRETGKGTSVYTPIVIGAKGTFRATIPKANRKIYYQFAPEENGQYIIESLVYTAPNEINPILDVYAGTFANPFFDHKQDGGGKSSVYTKNFRQEMYIVDDEIGNVFTFAIYVEGENVNYPVTVDFRIDRPKEHVRDPFETYMVIPEEQFKQTPEYDKSLYTFTSVANSNRVFIDGGRFRLNPADGYYHFYDQTTDTYGDILYAKITEPCVIMDAGFNMVEYAGNNALTLGNKNYKVFIEGYDHIVQQTAAQGFGTSQYDEWKGIKGYGDYCNSDGVYAVTQELKEFLEGYNKYRQIFYDGLGVAESASPSYNAAEGDQWLFACGYYKRK